VRRSVLALSLVLTVLLLGISAKGEAQLHDASPLDDSLAEGRAGDGSAIPSITLAQAITRARSGQPRIREALADEGVRRAELAAPAARWLPRLGATIQAVLGTDNNSASNWLGSGGAVEMPRIAGTDFLQDPSQIVWTPYLTTAVGIGLDQEVFDFGRIDAARHVADAEYEAARARTEGTELGVEARAREAYVAVEASHELLRAADAARVRAERIVLATQAYADQGLRPQVDVARAVAERARFVVAVEHARAALHVARAQLAAAVGADELELEAAEAPATVALPRLTDALAAIDSAPELTAAEAESRAALARVAAAGADLLPDLRLIATVMGSAGGAPAAGHSSPAFGAGGVPFVPNYYAGFVLRWRFFDQEALVRRDVASAESEAASARIDAAREDARLAIEVAWYTARGAETALEALEQARDAAVTSYEQVDARYREGLASAVEIADAENLRTSAEVGLAVGRFSLEQARAELARRMSSSSAAEESHE
jgi:outer membrane protein TolC